MAAAKRQKSDANEIVEQLQCRESLWTDNLFFLHVFRLFKTTWTKQVYCLEMHSMASIQEDFTTSVLLK